MPVVAGLSNHRIQGGIPSTDLVLSAHIGSNDTVFPRRILVQRAYNYRTRIERKIARGLGIRIDEARKLLNA